MAMMRPRLSPAPRALASHVSVLLLVVVALAGGCSAGGADEPGGSDRAGESTITATADEVSGGPTGATDGTTDARSEGVSPSSDAAATVPEFCASYTTLVAAIREAASAAGDRADVVADLAAVLKEFAGRVPDTVPPAGLPTESWLAVVALAEEITRLPDRPTKAELDAVEDRLSGQERAAVEDAFHWFQEECAAT